LKELLAAAPLIVMLAATGAQAADAPLIIEDETIAMASPTVWDGFYAGVGLTGSHYAPIAEVTGFLDGIVGYNVSHDSFVFGAEAWLSGWQSNQFGPGLAGGVQGRGGFLVTPGALAYGSLGVMGYLQANGAVYAQLGLGVEFAVADGMTMDIEYKHWREIGGPKSQNSVSASVLWHF